MCSILPKCPSWTLTTSFNVVLASGRPSVQILALQAVADALRPLMSAASGGLVPVVSEVPMEGSTGVVMLVATYPGVMNGICIRHIADNEGPALAEKATAMLAQGQPWNNALLDVLAPLVPGDTVIAINFRTVRYHGVV